MDTKLQDQGPFERLLTVTIAEAELEDAKTRAARRLSRELKVKGFRPGKAPRRIVESMVGSERLRSEAIEEALPKIVGTALEEAELEPAVLPSVADTRDTDDGVEVDIRVTLWPTVTDLPSYRDRRVIVESPDVTEDDLQTQLDRIRDQFAELEEVSRPARDGDFVAIDLSISRAGQKLDDASASDLLYEVGSESFLPGLDEPLGGAGTGDIKKFTTTLPSGFGEHGGEEVDAQILVKGVRAKKLPELTDEWVSDATEFDSVDEMREALVDGLTGAKLRAVESEFRTKLLNDLLDELELILPEALVGAEMEFQLRRFVGRLAEQDIELHQYLQITGQSEQQLLEDLRAQAERNLRTRILLESVANAEEISVEATEIDEALEQLAASADVTLDKLRSDMERSGQVEVLAGDILRQKALEKLVECADPVDADGTPVDFAGPARTGEAAGGHDEQDSNEPAEIAE